MNVTANRPKKTTVKPHSLTPWGKEDSSHGLRIILSLDINESSEVEK